jgi:hypothetical protein
MPRKATIAIVLGIFIAAGSPAYAGVDPGAVCKEKKAKAAGKKAADLLKAFGKNTKKANATKLGADISKAQSKFTKGFTKTEEKSGASCPTSGDASTIEAKVDAFVDDMIARVFWITQIIDETGDGAGNWLQSPFDIAVDGDGNVYVPAHSKNVFKITPGGVITEIVDNILGLGGALAVDGGGNVYVTDWFPHRALKITPGGVITEIIDETGDGAGNTLDGPRDIAVDGDGTVYVAGDFSNNAFKITPGGVITEIIDATGDGAGNTLEGPYAIAVDGAGNVCVTGYYSDNAFKITPGGVITEIIDAPGDGGPPGLLSAWGAHGVLPWMVTGISTWRAGVPTTSSRSRRGALSPRSSTRPATVLEIR